MFFTVNLYPAHAQRKAAFGFSLVRRDWLCFTPRPHEPTISGNARRFGHWRKPRARARHRSIASARR